MRAQNVAESKHLCAYWSLMGVPLQQVFPPAVNRCACLLRTLLTWTQAEALGNVFRTVMYPMNGPAGGGLLRLHSTYRHDLKIYSSDEGRVQTSAAAFTQGLLDLEGTSLTPILVRCAARFLTLIPSAGNVSCK